MAERVRKERLERPMDGHVEASDTRPTSTRDVSSSPSDIEQILDEIDDVLEANAEDFVRNYVQKGGQ